MSVSLHVSELCLSLFRLGANKPAEQVTEEELLQACRDANIVGGLVT